MVTTSLRSTNQQSMLTSITLSFMLKPDSTSSTVLLHSAFSALQFLPSSGVHLLDFSLRELT